MTVQVGKISRVALRDVWPHEERDFTTWLRDNVDVLSDQLGIELQNAEREQAAGSFSVDIVAETDDGRAVVVENQLEKSDHDHLGKLLTYLAAFDAKVAVWIVAEPRPEHVQAVAWLNQSDLADFFLLKVEAIVIGTSDPAPLLTKIVGPSLETAAVGATKKEFADRQDVRFRFWQGFIEAAKAAGSHYGSRTPTHDNWLDKGDGLLTWVLVIKEHEAQAQLYVQNLSPAGNRAVVSRLIDDRWRIEESFGGPLVWDVVEGRKHAKVTASVATDGYRDEHAWPQTYAAMRAGMERLQAAMRPYLSEAVRIGSAADRETPGPE